MSNRYNRLHFYFVLKALFGGLFLYAVTGLLLAFIIVTFFGSDHPHNIDEILYFIIPGFLGATGAVLGLILSIFFLKSSSVTHIKKHLTIYLPISVIVVILFLFY